MEHFCYSNMVSDNEDDSDDTKQRCTPRGRITLFKTVSCHGKLLKTTAIEENIHDLASPGTQLLTQPPYNAILTDIEEENLSFMSSQAELLRWHYRMGHCYFTRLRLLSALSIIPSNILKVKPPKCDRCLYGAMKKCPQRTKSANNLGPIWEASASGECVSVNHMESSTPGFIDQLKGKPTKQSYHAETIFLDHHIDLTYVYLQQGLSPEDTLE